MFKRFIAFSALILPFLCSAEASAAKPNVILVMTDDQGYFDLGCHGNPVIKTPNIDKMHSESARLTNYHVDPTCAPTRAALMTGRYRPRTGVWHTINGRNLLRRDEKTMADVFAASGYKTAIFGKWHLGDNYPFRPMDRGFQETLIHGGGGVGQSPDYWGNDYFDDTYFRNGKPEKQEGYCTDVWFDNALSFIEKYKDVPFFCYIPTNAPHGPLNVAEKYENIYKDKEAPIKVNAKFYGMVTNIDENMGRLEAKLAELGLRENTILVFTTDNGTAGGWQGAMRGKKGSQYEGGHRVPFIIRWPAGGIDKGADIDRLAAHFDILPTFIDLCGLKKPAGVKFDGISLKPLLNGKSGGWPERTLVVDNQRIDIPEKERKYSVMTDSWRMVDGKELFDIKADPEQKADIAEQKPETVEELHDFYDRWWDDVSVQFDEFCEIVIGSDHESPTKICSHDRHGQTAWNQGSVRSGKSGGGFWALEAERDGEYEVALRRWPEEANTAITAAVENGKALKITKAHLKIADFEGSMDVTDEMLEAPFKVQLKAGKMKMEAHFTCEGDPKEYGAYYVYIKRL